MRALFLLLSVYCVAGVSAQLAHADSLKLDIPKATWEPIFFEVIDYLTIRAGWPPLRSKHLPLKEIEVRVWDGFGRQQLRGYRFHYDGAIWTGQYAQAAREKAQAYIPRSGWDLMWDKLLKLDILTLPDSSTLPNEVTVLDGVSYVVEINKDQVYRTYHYSNPSEQHWPEAKKMLEIMKVLEESWP